MRYRIVEITLKDDGIWFYPQRHRYLREEVYAWNHIDTFVGTKPFLMFWKIDVYEPVKFRTKEEAVTYIDALVNKKTSTIIHDYP